MITAVDSNVLIDLFTAPDADADKSAASLRTAALEGSLVLSIICYSEVAARFTSQSSLDRFIEDLSCEVQILDSETAFLAGRFYTQYRKKGGDRRRILPDFLIAAHAQLHADRILTRDKRFFGASFPKLKAVSPADLA